MQRNLRALEILQWAYVFIIILLLKFEISLALNGLNLSFLTFVVPLSKNLRRNIAFSIIFYTFSRIALGISHFLHLYISFWMILWIGSIKFLNHFIFHNIFFIRLQDWFSKWLYIIFEVFFGWMYKLFFSIYFISILIIYLRRVPCYSFWKRMCFYLTGPSS